MPKKKKEKYEEKIIEPTEDAEKEAEVLGIELPPKLGEPIAKAEADLSKLEALLVQEGLGQNARKKALRLVKEAYGE